MNTINLLPEDYLKSQAQKRSTVLCLILFGAVMAGTATAYLVSQRSYARTREVLQNVNDEYARASMLLDQLQQLQARKKALMDKAQQTARLQERLPRSYLLGILTNALPQYTSLNGVEVEYDKVRVETPRDESAQRNKKTRKFKAAAPKITYRYFLSITVEGRAGTDMEVARFIANLTRHPLFEDVDLIYSEQELIEKTYPVRQFAVRLICDPDADVLDYRDAEIRCREVLMGDVSGSCGSPDADAPAGRGGGSDSSGLKGLFQTLMGA
jgi:Tfp pilus assembly protein PilN